MSDKKELQLTPKKFKSLNDQLEEMKTIGRKLLADKLDEYRAESNQEDSAAYNEVLEEKESLEREIIELEDMLKDAKVSKRVCNPKSVGVGCKVTVEASGKKHKYEIVSSIESDPEAGKLSDESPLGVALKGKKAGEKAKVNTPQGDIEYKVVSIN